MNLETLNEIYLKKNVKIFDIFFNKPRTNLSTHNIKIKCSKKKRYVSDSTMLPFRIILCVLPFGWVQRDTSFFYSLFHTSSFSKWTSAIVGSPKNYTYTTITAPITLLWKTYLNEKRKTCINVRHTVVYSVELTHVLILYSILLYDYFLSFVFLLYSSKHTTHYHSERERESATCFYHSHTHTKNEILIAGNSRSFVFGIMVCFNYTLFQ